ncbi:MAG: hypothetical protein KJT01_15905 [Gemmatimonadetes bacterium]|nr:hypothetical protein [Gemmatimonadota bacterium]
MSRSLVPVLLTLLLSACVRTNATLLSTNTAPRPALLPADVQIYRSADKVGRPFEEIALLNATGEASMTNEAKMLGSLRKKAAELGANGIILENIAEPSAGAKVAGAFLGTGAQRKGKAVAIFVQREK